jgi:hypothetical protein
MFSENFGIVEHGMCDVSLYRVVFLFSVLTACRMDIKGDT